MTSLTSSPGAEFRIEPGGLFFGELFGADLQGPANSVERIAPAAPVPQGVLQDARRTSSTMVEPSFRTWNASRTVMAPGSSSQIALA
jgi:hypothetical protein